MAPLEGTSGLNLSRKALCGIVSGHVTKWNNPLLTVNNNGVVLGTGQITFVHRSDSSQASFLLSNAMTEQCRYEFGPASEADPTLVSYAYPWTDHSTACTALPLPTGASLSNWPDQFPADQCGRAIVGPVGSSFASASGNSGVVALVNSTNGAIGYANLEFLAPIDLTGPRTANLQSQWDLTAATGAFQPPTIQGGYVTMATAIPHFSAAERGNPLQWSIEGLVPNPITQGAYPIAGFSWVEMYQCYQTHANGNNAFLWFKMWLDYLYGTDAVPIMRLDDKVAEVPPVWRNEIDMLLNDPVYGPNGSACAGKVGAY
ncbi:substrate-binding domain-containing protein [Bradyrhizobium sp. Arg816]|uniref:substrate-binding domain-containing protein n=1 Tax=Bradyrhizobium sp. Arg816 TaxID=2998491 RepID=UPI0034D48F2F